MYRLHPLRTLLSVQEPWGAVGLGHSCSSAAAMIYWVIRHCARQRCVCGGRSGRQSSRTASSDGSDWLGEEDWSLRLSAKKRFPVPAGENSAVTPAQPHREGGPLAPWTRSQRSAAGLKTLFLSSPPPVFMFLPSPCTLSPCLMEGPVRISPKKNAFCS